MTAAKMVASIINRAVSCIKPPAKSARLLERASEKTVYDYHGKARFNGARGRFGGQCPPARVLWSSRWFG
jgi:hypothetical protein